MTILFANNDLSTLATSINNAVTTATLAAGTGTKFPNPTGSDYFMLTFRDLATGLLNEIVKVTARVGDVLTIVRAQEGTTAQAWSAGDLADGLITAGGLTAMMQQANNRTRFTADTIFYVRTDGSNSNNGLSNTAGGAFLTGQYAIAYIIANYDAASFQATLQFGAGTFAGIGGITAMVGQTQNILINGVGSTTIFNTAITTGGNGGVTVDNCKFACPTDNALVSGTGGFLLVGPGVEFGACPGFAHIYANGGNISVASSYTISGGAASHYQAFNTGNIILNGGITITLTGTPAFSISTATISIGSSLNFGTNGGIATFSGAATGVRYAASSLSLINTSGSGANYIPGNSAGSVATGAVYI